MSHLMLGGREGGRARMTQTQIREPCPRFTAGGGLLGRAVACHPSQRVLFDTRMAKLAHALATGLFQAIVA